MDSLGEKCPIDKDFSLKSLEDDAATVESIKELMKQVDEYIPIPTREKVKPFLMAVEDVKTIIGRGTVATDRVERSTINANDEVEIFGIMDTRKCVCISLEMFRKILDSAQSGDNIGALLRGVEREQIVRGQV